MSRTPRAPLIEMLAAYCAERPLEMCTPGHALGERFKQTPLARLEASPWALDVTQVPGIDDLLAPEAAIAEAQRLAACAWGALRTWFLVNGTTSGVHAAMLATCSEGDSVVLPRAAHRSLLEGLILTGARPRWVPCEVDPALGFALPPTRKAYAQALDAGPARLLALSRPTYHGDAGSLETLADARARGVVTLVDEAWGAHLGCSPALPSSALAHGADLVVNSTHKTLPALSGAAMLHQGSTRVDAQRLHAAFALCTTTSPLYLTLASLDAARCWVEEVGTEHFAAVIAAAAQLRARLRAAGGLLVCGPERVGQLPGVTAWDPTRLVVSARERGWSGFALAAWLRAEHALQVEMADPACVVALLGNLLSVAEIQRLGDALLELPWRPAGTDAAEGSGACEMARAAWPAGGVAPLSPREAFFAPHRTVPVAESVGRICAEALVPYPPGIPLCVPGERIDEATQGFILAWKAAGGRLQGVCDEEGLQVRVVA